MQQRFQSAIFLYIILFSSVLTLIISSCSNGSSASDCNDSADGISIDSVLKDTLEEEKKDESVSEKPLYIRSKEEIEQFIESSPNRAKYENGIIPTIAEYVPEYASKLLDNKSDKGFIIVDKNTMKLYRYDKYGQEIEKVGIACSKFYGTKHEKADNRTPEGYFTISGIYNSTEWLFTDDAGYTSPVKGSFGPRFMRLKTPVSSQIGIHGAGSSRSIGRRVSHGCIRMTNDNIMRIHKLCETGMPVIVSPGPRDMAVNAQEGYDIPSVPVVKGGVPCTPGSISAYEADKKSDSVSNETQVDSLATSSAPSEINALQEETPAPVVAPETNSPAASEAEAPRTAPAINENE